MSEETVPYVTKNSNATPPLSRRLVIRPVGCPPELWRSLQDIREAQRHLDDYEGSNGSGKEYHRNSAVECLKDAHNALWVWISRLIADDQGDSQSPAKNL